VAPLPQEAPGKVYSAAVKRPYRSGEQTKVDRDASAERRPDSLRCQLVVIDGPSCGRDVALGREAIDIGSAAGVDLAVEDETVSRRHATVQAVPGGFLVADQDSTNGTFYEGSRITQAVLGPGAVFRVGRTSLVLRPVDSVEAIEPTPKQAFGDLDGVSLPMRRLFAVLEQVAPTESTVLVEGETGTGKELVAWAVHQASPRRSGSFVVFDCGAVPRELVESELFGHVRGAFTGATSDRPGAFLRANGGTIFIDELNSMPLELQPKLLRALESRSVKAVGSDSPRAVDVRVVAACGSDLAAEVQAGRFRADLFYRLSVVHVSIPPLRRRREDIGPIVRRVMSRLGIPDPGPVEGPNLERLLAHSWPGNVRELRNVIERAVAMSVTPSARFCELRIQIGPAAPREDLQIHTEASYAEAKEQLQASFEKRYLADLMERAKGNISLASRVSGLDRKHLKKLLRRHGMLASGADDE
jgi:DNA-binding NtrC family response regulator